MQTDTSLKGLRLANTLRPAPSVTAHVAGHLLQRYYADLLDTEQPEVFKALIRQLETRERVLGRLAPDAIEVGCR
jgi:hypothetical protein